MKWWVALTCDACRSKATVLVEAHECSNRHVHFEREGLLDAWAASHHIPRALPLGPAPGVR